MSSLLHRGRPPRRRRRALHPLAFAAIVILATASVTYYAFNQGLPFVHRFTLYALVSNSVNVRGGSPVRIAGIDVGTVQRTSPAGNATRIKFTVSGSGLPIHTDATIRIRDRLFLEGSYYLELDPGTPSAPILHDGGTIPLSQTSTPVQFYKFLSTFDVAARASFKNLLSNLNQALSPPPGQPLSDSGAGAFKRSVPQLTPVLKDSAWIAAALRGTRPGDVQNLLTSTSLVTGTLAANSTQLVGLIASLNRTSSALAGADNALAQSVSGLDQTLDVAPPALAAIDRSLQPTATLAQALDPSLRAAPPILDSINGAVSRLSAIVAPGERERLLASLTATLEGLPSLLAQLASPFPLTNQVTDCLATHVLPTFEKTVPDGPLSSGHPVWQDFIHFLPNIAGATASFDANGPYTRTLAGVGDKTTALGNVPGIGQIVGSETPGGSPVLGARPTWVGDLTAADFRPDVACATQKVPSLASPTAAAHARSSATAVSGR